MRKPVLAADGVAETTFKQQSSFFVKYAKKTVGVCKMPSAKWEVARIGFYISIADILYYVALIVVPVIATYIYAQPDCINFIINRVRMALPCLTKLGLLGHILCL
ncbi:hypothetical protein PsorP6_012604 [Peronosclerospora sorghi]|uniref:Uncharacterized protein n=1 Tax=Peronosclerospora sorghi TaxID=230839 RepID=A0ACC0WFV7_9STRA|nr:hypothetical protein PsorP6_012604 [Peronosclerospora sorghi]